MADVRALLAAERQSRRITHPHLSYTKSGLICTLCNLNVKSETLWEGHLRSANHRKNAQSSQESGATKGVKRKIEDVDEPQEEHEEAITDARKKTKSQPESVVSQTRQEQDQPGTGSQQPEFDGPDEGDRHVPIETTVGPTTEPDKRPSDAQPMHPNPAKDPAVDEAEWAAFEAEVAPLAAAKPDYSSHTITAAPVTAAQTQAEAAEDGRRRLELEAEAEKEEEERRLEDEFEVMDEMEERVRKLRAKRDALKNAVVAGKDTGQGDVVAAPDSIRKGSIDQVPKMSEKNDKQEEEEEVEEEEEDDDDWYA